MIHRILVPLAVKISSHPHTPVSFNIYRSYINKLTQYMLSPLFVIPDMTDEYINELYQSAAGVMLVGGEDVHPELYKKDRHNKTETSLIESDRLEIQLAKKCLADKKPILGICRGCQVIAIAAGGTLHQHLEDITKKRHHIENQKEYGELFDNDVHAVEIVSKTRAEGLFQKRSFQANSGHHQAVEDPGNDMVISARTEDGVAEIIEHKDHGFFCFGIQSHPEVEEESFSEPLFRAFASAVKQ